MRDRLFTALVALASSGRLAIADKWVCGSKDFGGSREKLLSQLGRATWATGTDGINHVVTTPCKRTCPDDVLFSLAIIAYIVEEVWRSPVVAGLVKDNAALHARIESLQA